MQIALGNKIIDPDKIYIGVADRHAKLVEAMPLTIWSLCASSSLESQCRRTSPNLATQHLDTLKHICQTHSRLVCMYACVCPLCKYIFCLYCWYLLSPCPLDFLKGKEIAHLSKSKECSQIHRGNLQYVLYIVLLIILILLIEGVLNQKQVYNCRNKLLRISIIAKIGLRGF